MRRIFATLLAIALIISVCLSGVFCFTVGAETDGIYTYEIKSEKATVTACDPSVSGGITIPSTLGGCPVTAIGAFAFCDCTDLTAVTIPSGVTTIGVSAFQNCESLTTVTIGSGLTSIGDYAFYNSQKLSSVNIPSGVTAIGEGAFAWCEKIKSITLPGSVTTIGAGAFAWCEGLTGMTIPSKVSVLSDALFFSCNSLTSASIPENVSLIAEGVFDECSHLTDIYYGGVTIDKWKTITIGAYNYPLRNATIHLSDTDKTTFVDQVSYTISYQLSGGKNNAGNPTKYTTTSDTITLKNPTRSGYIFKGWYTDSTFKTKENTIYKGSVGKKTFYAKWEKIYSITYKLNSGTNHASNPTTYTVSTATITLKNPTRKGYTFKGWYSDTDYKTKVTKIAKGSTGNKTLYAKWAKNTYTIIYKLNSGTNNKNNPNSYTITTATITLKNPTRKGYTFAGWYSDANYTTKVTSIAKGSTGNKTLYAKWTKNTYTITYKLNKGTNNAQNPATYTVTTATITLKNPTREGYTFQGWYSDAKYKTKVTKIAKGSTGNKTLYAKWKKK